MRELILNYRFAITGAVIGLLIGIYIYLQAPNLIKHRLVFEYSKAQTNIPRTLKTDTFFIHNGLPIRIYNTSYADTLEHLKRSEIIVYLQDIKNEQQLQNEILSTLFSNMVTFNSSSHETPKKHSNGILIGFLTGLFVGYLFDMFLGIANPKKKHRTTPA